MLGIWYVSTDRLAHYYLNGSNPICGAPTEVKKLLYSPEISRDAIALANATRRCCESCKELNIARWSSSR